MSSQNIVRAWKDATYRDSLTEAERAALPANPAGAVELSDADLGKVAGGLPLTARFCTGTLCFTFWCYPTLRY